MEVLECGSELQGWQLRVKGEEGGRSGTSVPTPGSVRISD